MYTLVLIMSLGMREAVSTQQIPGYTSLQECQKAIAGIYVPKNDSYSTIKLFCVPSPSPAAGTVSPTH